MMMRARNVLLKLQTSAGQFPPLKMTEMPSEVVHTVLILGQSRRQVLQKGLILCT